MTPSKPPALASWMLRHLLLSNRTEALEGDLLEEFQQRQSVAWYWRQVIGAIFASFANEVRADWVMVWTILFITAWACVLYAIPAVAWPVPMTVLFRLNHYLVAHGYYGTSTLHFIGYVFLYVMPFLFHLAGPLVIYLVVARNMNLRGFMRGLCAAAVAILCLSVIPFQPVLDYLSLHGLAYHWVQLWEVYEVAVMRQLIPLIAAMWVAQSGRKVVQPGVMAI
ncbi:MAG TPA: hypothetical protein VFZ27_16325 [Terriglobia bacterium]|nr:hypothetical protein [Terriglobia bacterium]